MIKKYLQKFFTRKKYTRDKSKEELPSFIEGVPEENSISLVVDKYYRPIIRINLQNIDSINATKFAEILYLLNKGFYQLQIVEMLKELALTDSTRTNFITKILESWKEYVDSHNSDETPCVSPASFSKSLRN